MKLYIAGLYASNFHLGSTLYRNCSPNARLLRDYVKHKLESYHYIKKGPFVNRLRKDGQRIFLDSGAYSAFTQGHEIELSEYAEFILANQDVIEVASVLDAIGDPDKTYKNQVELERMKCPVLPCFHFGEPPAVLEFYVKNYEYITIGGMVPIAKGPLEIWLDEIWAKYLTDENGISKIKVHGFGLTTRDLITKYPWYSVDSSTWVQAAARGIITFPEIPQKIAISARSTAVKKWAQHFNTLTPTEKQLIVELLEFYGLSVEEVMQTHFPRWALNCFTFARLGDMLGDDHYKKPFKIEANTLF